MHIEKAAKKSTKKIPEDFEDAQSIVTDSCETQQITDWWLHYSEKEFLIYCETLNGPSGSIR